MKSTVQLQFILYKKHSEALFPLLTDQQEPAASLTSMKAYVIGKYFHLQVSSDSCFSDSGCVCGAAGGASGGRLLRRPLEDHRGAAWILHQPVQESPAWPQRSHHGYERSVWDHLILLDLWLHVDTFEVCIGYAFRNCCKKLLHQVEASDSRAVSYMVNIKPQFLLDIQWTVSLYSNNLVWCPSGSWATLTRTVLSLSQSSALPSIWSWPGKMVTLFLKRSPPRWDPALWNQLWLQRHHLRYES